MVSKLFLIFKLLVNKYPKNIREQDSFKIFITSPWDHLLTYPSKKNKDFDFG